MKANLPRSSWKVTHPSKHKSRKFTKPYAIEYRIPDYEKIPSDSILTMLNTRLDQWNKHYKKYRHYRDAQKAIPVIKKWLIDSLNRYDVNIEYRIIKT